MPLPIDGIVWRFGEFLTLTIAPGKVADLILRFFGELHGSAGADRELRFCCDSPRELRGYRVK
jgi:hypothetical protein